MSLEVNFQKPLLDWFNTHGRKDLPWQHPRSAYRVWISEIMLQQTQVKTVIPYFEQFIAVFPTIEAIANNTEDAVLALWSGLGYYSRARNIYKTAQIITHQFQGQFPNDSLTLQGLPGIGETTAAAIISQAFNIPSAILDGNVKRVLSRYFSIDGDPTKAETKKRLWDKANACLSQHQAADYTQAIMDLGATCCTNRQPNCVQCPLNQTCSAFHTDSVHLFPNKKKKITIPQKRQQFLVLVNSQGEILLERRPPTGIWGGLWCLPAIDEHGHTDDYIEKLVKERFGLITQDKAQHLSEIFHSFSHYKLHINACILPISYDSSCLREPLGQWINPRNLQGLGIAKPVQQIVNSFIQQADSGVHCAKLPEPQ